MQIFRSRRIVERSLLTLGIGLVLAAIVGGGLEVAGFEVPVVSSVARQVLLAVLGVAVAVLSLWARSDEAPEQLVGDEAPHVMRTRQRGLVAAMPSEVVVDQPTEVWVQVCLPDSSGFVESLPQYTSSGEEIGKSDAKRSPGSVQFTEREGRLLNAVLTVTATSPYFEIDRETRTISVSPRHDSAKLVFQAVPTEVVTRARVIVSVTQQQDAASVTVSEVSVTARVLLSREAVSVPPSGSLHWNVRHQGIATGGVPLGFGILQGERAPADPEDPLGMRRRGNEDTVRPSQTQEAERQDTVPVNSSPTQVESKRFPPDPSSRTASRRWLVLTALAVSFAVLVFVAWKLLS
jgi:hypothetical protein